jgi:hypothetical protein
MKAGDKLKPGPGKLSATEQAYRRCAIMFVTVLFGGIGLIYAFLLLVDPWDTGRFPTPLPAGTPDNERRTSTASRGRNPRFDAAIFGNSRTYLIDPEKLSQATGYSFVSLGTPMSGPREQMLVARYFLRFHPAPAAFVFGADERWCDHDPAVPIKLVFPFWLYGGNLDYLGGLLSTRSFNAARARIKMALGRVAPDDPRGFLDYEAGKVRNFHPAEPASSETRVNALSPDAAGATAAAVTADTDFPGMEVFDALLAELPPTTRFMIMMPPVYHIALPRPGTQEDVDRAACKAALAERIGRRGGVALLDYLVDGAIARDPENFFDMVHYRRPVAHVIEDGIIAAFNGAASR